MTKKELVKIVAEQANITQKDALNALNAITETISDSVAKKEDVSIIGFGTFTTSYRNERNGINPSTGALIKIPAAVMPKFKAGKAFKEKVSKK